MLNIFGESAHYGHWTFCNILDFALFPQEYQASKKYFMYAVIVKFENSKTAFRNFGKFEKQSSKFWNIRKIGREQMNETAVQKSWKPDKYQSSRKPKSQWLPEDEDEPTAKPQRGW